MRSLVGHAAPDVLGALLEDERVLWLGRPSYPIGHSRRNIGDIAVSLLVIAGLAGAWALLQEDTILRAVTLLLMLCLCVALLVMWVVDPAVEKNRVRNTIYAITSERAIIVCGKQVFSQALNTDTRYRLSDASPGILEIWSHAAQARAEELPMRFWLEDSATPLAILEQRLGGGEPPAQRVGGHT